MLFCVAVIDYKTGYILDNLLIIFTVIGVIVGAVFAEIDILNSLFGGLTGLACYGAIYLIVRFIFKKEGFGSGDVMLLGAIGFFVGPINTIMIAVLSFYVSIPFVLIEIIKCKRVEKHFELPFGPAICLTTFIISLFPTEIYQGIMSILGF